jgi:hypothetical protein
MIKVRRLLGMVIVTGSNHELERMTALTGTALRPGDKICKLPWKHHVHRNPKYPMLIKFMEDKEDGKG